MSEIQKISIRFFDDREVRAVWDEERGSILRLNIINKYMSWLVTLTNLKQFI